MQYLLRFILASYVVFYHTGNAYFVNAGTFAVFGFYTLSGYIITRVLQEVYYKKERATLDFFQNRFWRLYPGYITCVCFGFLLAYTAPDAANYWNSHIRLPDTQDTLFGENGIGWLIPNISIIGLHLGIGESSPIRYAPPSWTTAIEVYFYIFLFFVGARSEKWCKIWLVISGMLSLIFLGILVTSPAFWPYSASDTIYGNVFALSLCFSLGSYTYFAQKRLVKTNLNLGYIAFSLAVIVPLLPWKLWLTSEIAFQYIKYLECLLVAVFLLHCSDKTFGKLSQFLGDLSYPIFLLHWQVAILLTAVGVPLFKQDIPSMVTVWLATLSISIMLVMFIEKPVLKIRQRVRDRK